MVLGMDGLKEDGPEAQVVGVVRIVETEPRLWYGGRLGVHSRLSAVITRSARD